MASESLKTESECGQKAVSAARKLSRNVSKLEFANFVPWVYNPLDYAWTAHREYLLRFLRPTCQVVFLGMNPGPWGMAQTGVPFGEVTAVREWLGINASIRRPENEHPRRPVLGFSCQRSEVSGQRLWGLFSQKFASPDDFFESHFVANFCPLVFMESSARNITPDKLPARIREPLERVCDRHLLELLRIIRPKWIIGVGAWSESCSRRVVNAHRDLANVQVGRILHPSPASPAANRDWSGTVTKQLESLGVW